MNKKQQPSLSSTSRTPAGRHWQLAVAVVALAAALTGCDRRAETTSTSSSMPASAASR